MLETLLKEFGMGYFNKMAEAMYSTSAHSIITHSNFALLPLVFKMDFVFLETDSVVINSLFRIPTIFHVQCLYF